MTEEVYIYTYIVLKLIVFRYYPSSMGGSTHRKEARNMKKKSLNSGHMHGIFSPSSSQVKAVLSHLEARLSEICSLGHKKSQIGAAAPPSAFGGNASFGKNDVSRRGVSFGLDGGVGGLVALPAWHELLGHVRKLSRCREGDRRGGISLLQKTKCVYMWNIKTQIIELPL